MKSVSVNYLTRNAQAVLDGLKGSDGPVYLSYSGETRAVLVDERAWRSMREALYLYSIPGLIQYL